MRELNFPNFVVDPDDLFGRDNALQKMQRVLRTRQHRPLNILGERVIGKTSLLNVIKTWARRETTAAIVDLPLEPDPRAFKSELLAGVCLETGIRPMETAYFDERGHLRLGTINEAIYAIEETVARRPDLYFIVCIDELDSLLMGTASRHSEGNGDTVLGFLNHLLSKPDLPLSFVSTMTAIPENLRKAHPSPFLNSANLIPLAPWGVERGRAFVEWLLEDRFRLTGEAHRVLFAEAGGHPYFTKAILGTLSEKYDEEDEGFVIGPAAVRAAAEASAHANEVDFTLENIWDAHFSPDEQFVLEQLFAKGEEEEGNGGFYEWAGSRYREAMGSLQKRSYVAYADERFRPRMKIIQRWRQFRRQQPQRPTARFQFDLSTSELTKDGVVVDLNNLEARLLRTLAKKRPLGPEALAEAVGVEPDKVAAVMEELRKRIVPAIEKVGSEYHYTGEVTRDHASVTTRT